MLEIVIAQFKFSYYERITMSIFGKILGGVFGKKKKAEAPQTEAPAAPEVAVEEVTAEPAVAEPAPVAEVEPVVVASPVEEVAEEPVDVNAVLSAKADAHAEDLDWKVSIVDLLKLLDIDSSYGARKELAAELGIDGYEGSAEQNLKLNKLVLAKLAENGGIVPAELLD